jgi:flagellar hook-length control protein FliK
MNNDITVTLKTPGELKNRQGTKGKKPGSDDAAFGQALAGASAGATEYRDDKVEPKQETQGVSETLKGVESADAVEGVTMVTSEMLAEKMQTVQTGQFIRSLLKGGEAAEEDTSENVLLVSPEDVLVEPGIKNLAEMLQMTDAGVQAATQMMESSGQGAAADGGVRQMDVAPEVHVEEDGAVRLGEAEEFARAETGVQKVDAMVKPGAAQENAAVQADGQVHKQMVVEDEPKEDKSQVSEIRPENHVVDGRVETVYTQRTTPEQEIASHVTQTGEMREEYADMVKDMIVRQISQGKQEIEISLTPKSLGKLIVKVAVEAGETTVSIICTNSKAMQAMTQKAGELGRILEDSLGDKMEVVVDTEKPDSYLQQEGRNAGQEQAEQERHASQERHKDKEADTVDFLQQLRLGLA